MSKLAQHHSLQHGQPAESHWVICAIGHHQSINAQEAHGNMLWVNSCTLRLCSGIYVFK